MHKNSIFVSDRDIFTNLHRYFTAAKCLDGYYGKYCENQCSFPKFGSGCQQSCLCTKSKCHFSTGCHFGQNGKILKRNNLIMKTNHVEYYCLTNLYLFCQSACLNVPQSCGGAVGSSIGIAFARLVFKSRRERCKSVKQVVSVSKLNDRQRLTGTIISGSQR